jgi:hypothetical protein
MKLLPLFLAIPALALAGKYSGMILDFQNQPVSGATVRIGSDSVTTNASGTYSLARSAGIARKTASSSNASHLALDGMRPVLTYHGSDISGRIRPGSPSHRAAQETFPVAARSAAAKDTLRVFWKGTSMLQLLLEDSTNSVQTVRIDTLWEAGNYFWNPLSKPGTVVARDSLTHMRTVTFGKLTWTVDLVAWNLPVSSITAKTGDLCPVGFGIPNNSHWNALMDSLGQNKWIHDTLITLGFPITTNFLSGTPYSNASNGGFIQVDVIEPYSDGDRSYDIWMSGRTKYGTTNLRCVKN